ncbi:MAG: flagellar biosynthesis protein FlhB [Magnetococcus sp. WYHC-3]
MAEDDAGKDSKTEDPTPKRLEDARNKGQVIQSREVATALLFGASTLLFYFQGAELWLALQEKMRFLLSGQIQDELTPLGTITLLRELIAQVIWDLLPFFVVLVLMAVLSALIQHGMAISFEPLAPKFSKISPLQGFKRLFSPRSLVELFKSLFKMIVVGMAVWWGIRDHAEDILLLADTSMATILETMGQDALSILWRVALAFIAMAVLDYMYQRYEFMKNLRMSKQEVKDEMKQLEGDPQIKARIRQIQREMAHRRMMQEVPKADVVITNPTHFSVALVYRSGEMAAPRLVAKGTGPIALKIRELARDNQVPLVENPPLARALYKEVELEQIIPPEMFKAVAEVLAYVYSLRKLHPRKVA